MKQLAGLYQKVIQDGLVRPKPPVYLSAKDTEKLGQILLEQFGTAYQYALAQEEIEVFKLSSNDKDVIRGAVQKELGKEKAEVAKKLIEDKSKEFEWNVNNSGKVKALIENSGVTKL